MRKQFTGGKRCLYINMPIWEEEELETAAHELKLNVPLVMERYSLFGGVPLYCFNDNPTFKGELLSLIGRLTLQSITCLQGQGLNESHMIFHRFSDGKIEGECGIKMKFASKKIQNLVYKRLKNQERTHLVEYLKSSHESSFLSSLKGSLFEDPMHDHIVGGKKFKKYELDTVKFIKMLRN